MTASLLCALLKEGYGSETRLPSRSDIVNRDEEAPRPPTSLSDFVRSDDLSSPSSRVLSRSFSRLRWRLVEDTSEPASPSSPLALVRDDLEER